MDSSDSGLEWNMSMQEFGEDNPQHVMDTVTNHSMCMSRIMLADSADELEVPDDFAIADSLCDSQILREGLKLTKAMPVQQASARATLSIQEIRVLNLIATQPFYFHLIIFRGDISMLRRFFALAPDNLSVIINEVDHRGNTPLTLAIKLSHLSSEFFTMTRLLLSHGADPRIRDAFGWSPLDEAVAKGDRDLVGMLFDHLHIEKMKQWEVEKRKAVNALEQLPDFYMELKWEFDSSVIPLVGKIAPHDICKIWKSGSAIRLDMTLVGWKKLRSKRRNISLLFHGLVHASYKDITLINHSKRLIVYPLEPLDFQEREAVLSDILKADPVQGELALKQCTITPVRGWSGKPTLNKISNWKCGKFDVQLQAVVSYVKRGHGMLLVKEKEYFSKAIGRATRPILPVSFPRIPFDSDEPVDYQENPAVVSKEDTQFQHTRKGKVSVWMTSEFPVSLRDFLPVLEMLSPGNSTISKLHEFLTSDGFTKHFSTNMFPVKVELPLSLSIRALVTFTKMELGHISQEVFQVPIDYPRESRKVAQKTLSCPKKRMVFANIAV